jgi:hypothetical protein
MMTFHNGNELDKRRAAFIAQEAIDFHRMISVGLIECDQRVPFHAVLFQA